MVTLRARAFDTIVLGGVTAGVLDILDAFVVTTVNGGTSCSRVARDRQRSARTRCVQGGVPAAALGLGLHFLIAIGAATVYLLASRQLPVLLRRPVLCGLTFGLAVWVFMYYVVLPITFGRPNTIPALPLLVNQLAIHAVGVGLPIAIMAARSTRRAVGGSRPA